MPTPFGSNLVDTLAMLPVGTVITANGSQTFNTNQVTYVAFDATVTNITGGSGSPGVTLAVQRLGGDGATWYTVMSTTITSATAPTNYVTLDLGPGLGTYSGGQNGTQHALFATSGRLTWTLAGTTPATSVTLSVSLVGR